MLGISISRHLGEAEATGDDWLSNKSGRWLF